MTVLLYLVIALVALAALCLVLVPMLRVYARFNGTRVITCPETKQAAAVEVDAKHAALSTPRGHLALRLQGCSRWPERQGCGQECLKQIEAAPMDCLLRTILTRWYAGQACAICHKPIPQFNWMDIQWLEFRPALMDGEGRTFAWEDFPPEELPEALTTHRPVCWDCHHAERFRQCFSELVVDRPEH
jgi:hypothetical protein